MKGTTIIAQALEVAALNPGTYVAVVTACYAATTLASNVEDFVGMTEKAGTAGLFKSINPLLISKGKSKPRTIGTRVVFANGSQVWVFEQAVAKEVFASTVFHAVAMFDDVFESTKKAFMRAAQPRPEVVKQLAEANRIAVLDGKGNKA